MVDLSLQDKQLHWTVVGPPFRPLHFQIDELVEAWRELADTVAERLSRSAFPRWSECGHRGGHHFGPWHAASLTTTSSCAT